ncbi:GNAT family N-acetyltransferase [Longicatena caecimuris]|uniref:GNAT family N-acetyltransferase n=1 Tax=Longicatena caecimuris TaxID=1796635 RepID=UPI0022E26299|nr:GNAT family N-acetyltransferase [Longicatena caecimuris]
MKKLTIENWKELQPYIALADYHEYNSNAMTLLMWSNRYEAYFETYEHFALVYTKMPHHEPVWLMPYCALPYRKEALEMLAKRSEQLHIAFEVHSMTKEFKDWLIKEYPQAFLIWDCYNARDYVYDRMQQQTLSGKKMQKRRNHFHAFEKLYEGRYYYKPLTREDIPHVMAFLKRWKATKKEEEYETIDAEIIGIELLFQYWEQLPVEGGCIYIDNQLEAFSITSRLAEDMVQIHVEKANRAYRGLYIAILKCYLETLPDTIRYLNREDDMGLPELRKAKSDMQPIYKIQKFGSCHQALKIHQADAHWKDAVMQLWETSFADETKASSQYYFTHFYHEEDTWLLTSQQELISMLQLRPMDISLHGKKERVYFVVGVATQKAYEGCGYMKQLLHSVLQKEPYASANFILLQAYEWEIYKSSGFVETYMCKRWKLDKQAYLQDEEKGKLTTQFTISALVDIYQTYTKDKEGYRIRDKDYFIQQFLPYADLWQQTLYVYEEDQQPCGYLLIEEHEQDVEVIECAYTTPKVFTNMLSHLAQTTKKVYLRTSVEEDVIGKGKLMTVMMVKQLHKPSLPLEHLYLNETI